MSKSSLICLCLFLSLTVLPTLGYAAASDRIPGPIDSASLVELRNHISLLARPQFDQGPVDPSRVMHVTMLFLPTAQQEEALQSLLAEQRDPKSAQYHKWLKVPQYADQFGLSPADIQKVSTWLRVQGFKVTYVANGRDFLSFQGTAALVQTVFHTQIHNYNVKGKMHFANVTPPMIPAALNGIVGGFRGLHDFVPRPMLRQHPNYTFTDDGNTYTFIAPGDLATLYDITPLYNAGINGAGVNVVIAGQSDIYVADINYFRGAFEATTYQLTGCPLDSTGTILQAGKCTGGNFDEVWPDGDPGFSPGDLGESDLDIEIMGGVAPGAEIVFVTSPVSDGGVDTSVSYAVDQTPPLGTIISYSYGLCEALVTAPDISSSEQVYQKAVSLGISMFAASGDSAAAICDAEVSSGDEPATFGASVSYPASSAYVTGVGGTEFDESKGTGPYWSSTNGNGGGSATKPIPETAWNDTGTQYVGNQLDGSGGGPSNCAFGSEIYFDQEVDADFEVCESSPNGGFPKPTWQSSVTPSDGVRDVPDIAFSASNVNDPYIVCVPQSELGDGSSSSTSSCYPGGLTGINNALSFTPYASAFGGTSAPTPVTAGTFALLTQYLKSSGLGLVNTELYNLFSANPAGVFNEIYSGTNGVTGGASSNIVTCIPGDPTFETSTTVVCPSSTSQIGFAVGGVHTYSEVTGVGSVDINAFVQAWAASQGSFTVGAAPNSASLSAGASTSPIQVTITPQNGFSSTVTFSCPGAVTGVSCTFNPTTVTPDGVNAISTSLIIQTLPNMATGAQSVTVSATGGGVTQTSTVSLTVGATTESYTLTAQSATYTINPGQTATISVTVSSTNGFVTGTAPNQTTVVPVTYTCTSPASETNCTAVPPSATNATSVTFNITTTAPTSASRHPFGRGSRIFYATLLPGLLGIVLTFGSRKRSLRGMRMLGLIMVLGFSTLWLGSCGGSSSGSQSNQGTPPGNYTITLKATMSGNQVPYQISPSTITMNVQ